MTETAIAPEDRVFLVMVDETAEMQKALRFACRRAQHTGGRVALMHVAEKAGFEHWVSVGDLMREEARSEAELLMQKLAAQVNDLAGKVPILHMREGDRVEQLFQLLEDEPNISILVLGAATGKRGPGPLISALTGKHLGNLHIPLTLVPDSLTDAEIDSIS